MILTSLFFRDSKKKKKKKTPLYDELNKDLKSLESFHSDLPQEICSIIYKVWDAYLFRSEKEFLHHMTSLINHLAKNERSLKAIKKYIYKVGR